MYPQSLSPVQQVDFALLLIFVFSAVVLGVLTIITLYFLWRYNHKRNPVPTNIKGNLTAEILWTLIPSLMIMGLFYYGWTGYQALRTVPDNAMEVEVTAKMFSWTFTYENGKSSSYLAVPVGTPVKLNLRSVDVIHSFFVPAFRIKMDTVPGMKTYAWFRSEREGVYDIYCAEYCGLKHSAMLSTVRAMPQKDFDTWLADTGPADGPKAGLALMDSQGCFSCHTVNGSGSDNGPDLKGLYGRRHVVIINKKEKEIIADEAYLREAIIAPGKSLVKGYDDTMPAYEELTESQLVNIIEYLRSIGQLMQGEDADHSGHTQAAPATGGNSTSKPVAPPHDSAPGHSAAPANTRQTD